MGVEKHFDRPPRRVIVKPRYWITRYSQTVVSTLSNCQATRTAWGAKVASARKNQGGLTLEAVSGVGSRSA